MVNATREEAREFFHKLTDDILKHGAYRVMKSDFYVFWGDDKKRALKTLEKEYDKIFAQYAKWTNIEQEDYDYLNRQKEDDIMKIENADNDDVIVVNAEGGDGIVDCIDYEIALASYYPEDFDRYGVALKGDQSGLPY